MQRPRQDPAPLDSGLPEDRVGSRPDADGPRAVEPPLAFVLSDCDSLPEGLKRLAQSLRLRLAAEQVWVGQVEQGRVGLAGGSPLLAADLGPEDLEALVGAMEEAVDQACAIAVPCEPDAARGVDLEHRGLQQRQSRCVVTIPLGLRGEPLLAVTLLRASAFAAAERAALVEALAGVAAAARWMQQAEHPWHRRAADAVRLRVVRWRRGEVRWQRRGAIAAVLAVLLLGSIPVDDRIHGSARVEGEQQRVLAAPADGFVKTAYVRPGDVVGAGDVLLDLVDADLRLERERWIAQMAQHENGYAAAMAQSERSAAATAMARAAEAQAQLELVEGQLARGRLVAPFDAIVIQGDWSQAAGAPVRQGDALLTLATQGRLRIVVEVDEVDIRRVRLGQAGTLALSGWAFRDEPLVVERIAPMARASNGRNVFEVEARLTRAVSELRPGLVGRGELSAGRVPWLWSTARDAWLRIRLTVWRWWG